MARKPVPERERIYIDELAKIVNREVDTIRKWETHGKLPKHLLPERGHRNWRYWTHAQVHGERGIVAWMKRNDMRPGRYVTDPSKEAEHVANLRKPRYLNGRNIQSAKKMADHGRTSTYIVKKIHPRTRYVREEATESALRRVFKQNGWEWPKPARKRTATKKRKRSRRRAPQVKLDKALLRRTEETIEQARAS